MCLTSLSQRKCFPALADEWISMFIRAPHQSHHFLPSVLFNLCFLSSWCPDTDTKQSLAELNILSGGFRFKWYHTFHSKIRNGGIVCTKRWQSKNQQRSLLVSDLCSLNHLASWIHSASVPNVFLRQIWTCLSLFHPLCLPSLLYHTPEAAVLIFLPYGSSLRYSQKPGLFLASAHTVTMRVHKMLTLQANPLTLLPCCYPDLSLSFFFQDTLHLYCDPFCLSHFHTYYIFTALIHFLPWLNSSSFLSAGNGFMMQPMAPAVLSVCVTSPLSCLLEPAYVRDGMWDSSTWSLKNDVTLQ